jgi:hypothetical protein
MDSSACRKLVMITGQNVVADDTKPRGVRVVRDHFPGGGTNLVRLWIPEFEPFGGVEGEADH